jgi:hypothetical protein
MALVLELEHLQIVVAAAAAVGITTVGNLLALLV